VENPPKSSFTVSATSGKANDTEFEFTVNEVNADAITLFPYGTEKGGLGSVLIPKSAFTGGKAIVKFTYAEVGVFPAVVVSNNHADDGSSVKNSVSTSIDVTITSDRKALKKFSLEFKVDDKTVLKSTKTTPDPITPGAAITVSVPFGVDKSKLIPVFETDPFVTVKVGTVVIESGKTLVDFSAGPVTFTFTPNDNSLSASHVVTANVTPAETYQGIKTVTGKLISKAAKDKVITGFADTTSGSGFIVLYDTLGTPVNKFDSVRLSYAFAAKFAKMEYKGGALAQDSLFKGLQNNTPGADQTITVVAENSTERNYPIYIVAAPKMTLRFAGLIPEVVGTTTNFNIELRALKQAGKSIVTTADFDLPAGVTVVGTEANGLPFVSGLTSVDYTKPVVFELTVLDTNIGKTYVVTYTATLVQL
jgi:hypothetical protein